MMSFFVRICIRRRARTSVADWHRGKWTSYHRQWKQAVHVFVHRQGARILMGASAHLWDRTDLISRPEQSLVIAECTVARNWRLLSDSTRSCSTELSRVHTLETALLVHLTLQFMPLEGKWTFSCTKSHGDDWMVIEGRFASVTVRMDIQIIDILYILNSKCTKRAVSRV